MSFHISMGTYVEPIFSLILSSITDMNVAEQKGQKPVRVGNGAVSHLQLDIYGELLDSIYLAQKLSKPCERPSSFPLLGTPPDHETLAFQ